MLLCMPLTVVVYFHQTCDMYFQNDCVSKKLHYSLQVLNGVDYIANDTGTDLSTTLEYIPGDIAMMMPTDQLEKVPATACMAIMGNIGKAKIDMIPLTGAGMDRRKSLANITMKCIVSISSCFSFQRFYHQVVVECRVLNDVTYLKNRIGTLISYQIYG